jgi:serpin B
MRHVLLLPLVAILGCWPGIKEARVFRFEDSTMSPVVEGNTRFALDLYAKLLNEPGNLFSSPKSISTALAMAYAGARGETAAQMSRTLHFEGPRDKLDEAFAAIRQQLAPRGENPGYRLSVANRLWGQQGFHFLPDFLALTRDYYGAELAQVDFINHTEDARTTINEWVEKQTESRIKDLVPQGVLSPLTRLVLTNAVYFKGTWSRPFVKALTKEDDFHVSSDKTTRVPMMYRSDDLRLGNEDGLKALELPYGNGDLAALFLLPDKVDGLAALERSLDDVSLKRWLGSLRKQKVNVFLPRFTFSSAFSLSTILSELGMPAAFDPDRADFSGMSTQDRVFISAVLHKAFVDVNEEGTEAAAATGVAVGIKSAISPHEPIVFRADRPFLFLIVDNRSKSILFIGRVVNPRAQG